MRRQGFKTFLILSTALLMAPVSTRAANPSEATLQPRSNPAGDAFFEKKIRPLLSSQCFKCHSASATKLKGNLFLDSLAGAMKGGDTGPAVVPGDPAKSLLIEAVSYTNDDLKMPPRTRLPESAVADLKQWVKMGAPWPGQVAGAVELVPAGPPRLPPANYDKLRKTHWAWQPLTSPQTPTVRDSAWPHGDIDHFILAKLEQNGLHPVADADKASIIRRATFDLTGLPPTPQAIDAFVKDTSADAFANVVDRLLASTAFGERWGRHWLDVVRYADSTGSSRNFPYEFAWRYRDYVIDSFNQDKPYNQFVAEQIAGDQLPYKTPEQHNQQLIATGFLAIGVKDLNEKDHAKFVMDNVDEQIDTTSRSILALTISCARCHDHKFDPIPQSDYYAMAGIFKSSDILAGLRNRQGGGKRSAVDSSLLIHLDGVPGAPAVVAAPVEAPKRGEGLAKLRKLRDLRQTLLSNVTEIQQLRDSDKPGKGAELREKAKEIRKIQAQIDDIEGGPALTPAEAAASAMGVRDDSNPTDTRICIHGDVDNLGASVQRGFVSLVTFPSVPTIDRKHSGRLELAEWLTSKDNPLTARVIVNRIWEHLLGNGLVRTVDNFGSTGEAPSNPELLDYLAQDFTAHGWSVKSMIRAIVLSRAYQLSSTSDSHNLAIDPADRLVWRMEPRRLDAEEIRDAMLADSDRLDPGRPSGSMVATLDMAEIRNGQVNNITAADVHRSIYIPIVRDMVPPVLELFDFAEPTMVTGQRDVTTVATQALYLMNDPFVVAQSKQMARRVLDQRHDEAGQIELSYQIALPRPVTGRTITRLNLYQRVNAGQRSPDP